MLAAELIGEEYQKHLKRQDHRTILRLFEHKYLPALGKLHLHKAKSLVYESIEKKVGI